jgi:ATP phosphoribosyltransferase
VKISLGLPKGSLEEATLALFTKAGIHIRKGERSYFPTCDDPGLDLVIMRPQELPRYVEEGILDACITGQDWTAENGASVVEIAELTYSKNSRRKCAWVLAVPESSRFKRPEDLRNRRIATELVETTKRYFRRKKVPVKVEFSWGATEVKPPRLADAIVELTETGSSLRANRLRIIDVVMETATVLIANRHSWKNQEKRDKLENLTLLLQGTLAAENYIGLKCNVRSNDLARVLKVLPALHNPTVSNLSDKGWQAVETFIHFQEAKHIVPLLKRAGASGIVEFQVSKVIP